MYKAIIKSVFRTFFNAMSKTIRSLMFRAMFSVVYLNVVRAVLIRMF